MTYTQEQIDRQYNKSPAVIKHIIFAADTADKIMAIGEKNKLHIDQIGLLADEITHVLLGLTPSSRFAQDLQESLRIGPEVAQSISGDVNKDILLPIRETLQQISKPDLNELPSADQLLHEIENPKPAWEADKVIGSGESGEQGLGNSGIPPADLPTAESVVPKAPEPDLFEKKLAKTFVLPRVQSATREDVEGGHANMPALPEVKEVDPYREMPA